MNSIGGISAVVRPVFDAMVKMLLDYHVAKETFEVVACFSVDTPRETRRDAGLGAVMRR